MYPFFGKEKRSMRTFFFFFKQRRDTIGRDTCIPPKTNEEKTVVSIPFFILYARILYLGF